MSRSSGLNGPGFAKISPTNTNLPTETFLFAVHVLPTSSYT
jgi:hypothetical protein